MTDAHYLAGRLLLAMPGMGDPRFDHAAIAMCVHDENGAFGIGIGHLRTGITIHGLLKELGIAPGAAPDGPVHHGGPVEPGRGFILHTSDWTGEGTLEVDRLCAVSASLDILRAIAEGQGPRHWMIALGYAGWGRASLKTKCGVTAGLPPRAGATFCSNGLQRRAGRQAGGPKASIQRCWRAKPAEPERRFRPGGTAWRRRSCNSACRSAWVRR